MGRQNKDTGIHLYPHDVYLIPHSPLLRKHITVRAKIPCPGGNIPQTAGQGHLFETRVLNLQKLKSPDSPAPTEFCEESGVAGLNVRQTHIDGKS